MDRTIEILTCDTIGSLPSTEQILTIPREKVLRIIFLPSILTQRESIGADWREKLPGFSVGIHMIEPEINICKLITEEEVAAHSAFFEQCGDNWPSHPTSMSGGKTKGLLIVDLAAKSVLTAGELGHDLHNIMAKLGYDLLQASQAVPPPGQAIRISKGLRR